MNRLLKELGKIYDKKWRCRWENQVHGDETGPKWVYSAIHAQLKEASIIVRDWNAILDPNLDWGEPSLPSTFMNMSWDLISSTNSGKGNHLG